MFAGSEQAEIGMLAGEKRKFLFRPFWGLAQGYPFGGGGPKSNGFCRAYSCPEEGVKPKQ